MQSRGVNRRTFLFGALAAGAGLICPPVKKFFVMSQPKIYKPGIWAVSKGFVKVRDVMGGACIFRLEGSKVVAVETRALRQDELDLLIEKDVSMLCQTSTSE